MNKFILKARFITLGLAVALLPFSIRFCHLALLLFMVSCLAEGNLIQKGRAILQNPFAWILPLFFILHVISVAYSENVSNAWTNVDKKIAFFFAPLVIVTATPFTKEEIRKILWVFVAACVVGSIICFINAIIVSRTDVALWNFGPREPYLALHPGASGRWPYFSYIGLASGIGIHPTYFALYLLVSLLIVLRTVTKQWLMMLLVVYVVVVIVLLSSRIVAIATALTLLLSQRRLLIAGVLAIVVILLINPVALYRNAQEYTQSNFTIPPKTFNDNPISIRTSLWWLSAKAMRDVNPVIGTGAGDVEDTIVSLADQYNVHNILNTSDPHNQYLHTCIALGAVGLLSLLAVFAVPLVALFRQREFLACAGVFAFLAVCATESALELQKGIVLFSLFVSLTGNQLREGSFSIQRLKYA